MNDSAADQVVSDSMGSHDGVWQYGNTADRSDSGMVNGSLSFDGVNDYVVIPNHADFNQSSFSFSAWLRFDGASTNWNRILSKKYVYSDTTGYEITLWSGDTSLIYVSGSSGSTYAAINTIDWVGTGWHHLVVTYDGPDVNVWCDNTHMGSGTITPVASNTRSLYLGKVEAESTTMWDGLMDDIRIYDSVLTSDHVAALWNEGSGTELYSNCIVPDNSSSSSSSSMSSESSPSSEFRGDRSLRFTFDVEGSRTALCFSRHEGQVYAGLSLGGKVIVSSNLSRWDDFAEIGDESVTAMTTWANGLFMGTSPGGMIWTKNFTTGSLYKFVQTRDQCVSALAVYNNKLYAGTSPMGIVYSFDGRVWREEYTAYGSGITSMVGGDMFYIFLKSAETPVVYNGSKWAIMPLQQNGTNGSVTTVASARFITADSELVGTVPPNPCHNIYSATMDGNSVVFGGQGGAVLRYSSGSLSKIFQTDAGDVTSLANVGSKMNLAAIGGVVYLLDENNATTGTGGI
jgi:hypothetical protein